MKKLLCVLLSIAMLFLFVACGGTAQEDVTETKEENLNNEAQNNGLLSSFTATTLDGKEVDESIFEGKITMVNIWATFCGPCIREMPDLQKLHKAYKDKDFQIVGICCDIYKANGVYDEGMINEAKAIVEETGVRYLNLLPSDDLDEKKLNSVTSVPETFFVDEKGNLIGSSYIGSRSYEDWAVIIDSVLENQK